MDVPHKLAWTAVVMLVCFASMAMSIIASPVLSEESGVRAVTPEDAMHAQFDLVVKKWLKDCKLSQNP